MLQEMHYLLQGAQHHVQWQQSKVSVHRKVVTRYLPDTWLKIRGREIASIVTGREAESRCGGGNER